MKSILVGVSVFLGVVAGSGAASAQQKPAPTLKAILVEQLKTSHNLQQWFVPASKAVDGLTFEQATWKQGKENHSIAQLVNHLTFWDRQQLEKFKVGKAPDFSGDNEETFKPPRDKASWDAAVKQMDEVMTGWEQAVEGADDAKLQSWYSTIAHIGTHNAYHTGQILYIRKQQGSWDASKGVK
ncbi:MAG: DinB family protein [Acidobacteriota bacterium]|nr:DinB family protein [Acidobacteriota bacterium]